MGQPGLVKGENCFSLLCNYLTLSMLGKNFSRSHSDIFSFFFFFLRKCLTFHTNVIFMICQSILPENKIINLSAEFAQRLLNVDGNCNKFSRRQKRKKKMKI